MFTYSTSLSTAITSTLNTAGGSALLDDEEERVTFDFFFLILTISFSVFQKTPGEAIPKDIELPPSWVLTLNMTPKGINLFCFFYSFQIQFFL